MNQWTFSFKAPLHAGVFQGRQKRFFAQIWTQDGEFMAHLPNTGSLRGVNQKGLPCLYSLSDDPERQLPATLEAIQSPQGVWVGVNTQTPNRVVKRMIQSKIKPDWSTYDQFKPEFKISAESRLDFALWKQSDESKKHFIEIKNVTLMEELGGEKQVMFPDAVTERGQKHLKNMMNLLREGHTCELVFFVQRDDGDFFKVASHIDFEYASLLREAQGCGLLITPLKMTVCENQICIDLIPMEIRW
jgi:sugar fermentation stimulation protein A